MMQFFVPSLKPVLISIIGLLELFMAAQDICTVNQNVFDLFLFSTAVMSCDSIFVRQSLSFFVRLAEIYCHKSHDKRHRRKFSTFKLCSLRIFMWEPLKRHSTFKSCDSHSHEDFHPIFISSRIRHERYFGRMFQYDLNFCSCMFFFHSVECFGNE